MTDTMLTHEAVLERGLIERYVAGRLPDGDERAAFETHLLTCETCREDVRLGLALRAEFAATPTKRGRSRWLVGMGLAVAAGLATLLVTRGGGTDRVRPLGAVAQPPIYLGVPVRGDQTAADSQFDAAMQAYGAGDYTTAAAGLERALAAGVDSAPALFFLGAARLVGDHPAAATDAFRRVISLGESPYLPEAHYYLGKALLRQGQSTEALGELRQVAGDSLLAANAVALADSIARLLQR